MSEILASHNIAERGAAVTARGSYDGYLARNEGAKHIAIDETAAALDEAIKALPESARGHVDLLHKEVAALKQQLEEVSELKNGRRIPAAGEQEGFTKASTALAEANRKLASYLKGEKINIKIDGKQQSLQLPGMEKGAAAESPEKALSASVRKSYLNWEGSVKKAETALNDILGMAKANGWSGLGKTAQHHLNGMKFWEEGVAQGRGGAIAFRGGAMIAAGGAITDALVRSRNSDGDERSVLTRGGELLAGLGIGAGALLAGRAV